MAASDSATDDSLYPIAVLIDELKNEDVQVILATITTPTFRFAAFLEILLLDICLMRRRYSERTNFNIPRVFFTLVTAVSMTGRGTAVVSRV